MVTWSLRCPKGMELSSGKVWKDERMQKALIHFKSNGGFKLAVLALPQQLVS